MLWLCFGLFFGALGAAPLMNWWVHSRARPYVVAPEQVDHAQVGIVLGAMVYGKSGRLSPVLEDRVDAAISLYKAGKVERLLMSGDHGQSNYDEVNAMRRYARDRGVPDDRIFTDHAGFNTYDTMVRARKVFMVDNAVVITNGFHLDRSVFLARSAGIKAQGVVADQRAYADSNYNDSREYLARCKAVLNVYLLRPNPAFLGPEIPITGSAKASHDD